MRTYGTRLSDNQIVTLCERMLADKPQGLLEAAIIDDLKSKRIAICHHRLRAVLDEFHDRVRKVYVSKSLFVWVLPKFTLPAAAEHAVGEGSAITRVPGA